MPTLLPLLMRWAARLSALFVASVYVFIVIGEFYAPHSGPPGSVREWTGLFLLSCAILGMLVAWRRELPGAVVSLGALALFAVLIPMRQFEVIAVAAIPGFLYLMDYTVRHPTAAAR